MAFAAHSSGASRTVVLKSLISNAWTATAPHFPRRGIFGVRLAEERAPRRWGGLGEGHCARASARGPTIALSRTTAKVINLPLKS